MVSQRLLVFTVISQQMTTFLKYKQLYLELTPKFVPIIKQFAGYVYTVTTVSL